MNHLKRMLLFVLMISITSLSAFVFSSCNREEKSTLEQITEKNVLTVVGSGGYPPFNFYDEDDNIVGFDVDTGLAISQELGVILNYETSAWDGLIDGLKSGHYDAILGSMAITQDRLNEVNFTLPYYYSGAQLFVRSDSGITGTMDMFGKDIAVATGTTFADDVIALGGNPVYYEDDNQTLSELLSGRVDGVITDRLVGIQGMKAMIGGDRLMMVGDLLRTEEMALAVRKTDQALLDKLNEIISELHSSGRLSEISQKWFDGEDITQH